MLGDPAKTGSPNILIHTIHMRETEQLTEHWNNYKVIELLIPTLFDELSEIVSIKKADQTVIFYNRAGFELLKLEPEEVVGRKCYELIGREEICNNCPANVAKKTKRSARAEAYFESIGKWFEINSMPVCDKHGEVLYIIEILRDITHIKHLQEKLKSYEAQANLIL